MSNALLNLDDRLTPPLRRALRLVFTAARGRIPIADLERIIRSRGLGVSQVELVLDALPALLHRASVPLLEQATTSAAALEVRVLKHLDIPVRFDLVNRDAVTAAARQGAKLVTVVTAETRQAIRTVIAAAIEHGLPPREAARLIRTMIGVNERQGLAVLNYRARLLERGLSRASVKAAADRYTAKLIRQRAQMIARTETIDALTTGQQSTWMRSVQEGWLPPTARQKWLVAYDEPLCPLCRVMRGRTAPIGGFFETPLGLRRGPTLHPHCRCAVAIDAKSVQVRRAA